MIASSVRKQEHENMLNLNVTAETGSAIQINVGLSEALVMPLVY